MSRGVNTVFSLVNSFCLNKQKMRLCVCYLDFANIITFRFLSPSYLLQSCRLKNHLNERFYSGKVTPVKHQGQCGSCWTFAGIAAFEGHYAIKTGGLKRFAEQEFLDCTYEGEFRFK